MKIKELTPDEARFCYFGIRERLAAQQLAKKMGYKITNISDETSIEPWDIIYSNGQDRYLAEIKVRKRPSTDYQDWILEYRKYSSLLHLASGTEAKKAQLQPIFLVFFTDKVVYWNMNEIKEENFFMEELRATSVNGDLTTRQKKITHLQVQNGVEIDYILDHDNLNKKAREIFEFKYPNTTLTLTNEQ